MISDIWRERIYCDITEQRNSYQVTYLPINLKNRNFATLYLTFENILNLEEIVKLMEFEFYLWLKKFPVPIMVTSFSKDNDQVISLNEVNKSSHIYGYLDINNSIILSWDNSEIEFPDKYYNSDITNDIYQNMKYTPRKLKEDKSRKYIKEKIQIKNFIDLASLIWLSVTVVILILGLVNIIVGSIALLYSLYMVIKKYMRFKGFYTSKDKSEKDKLTKMKHYYYHCELNPDGFMKLKIENLNKKTEC